MDWTELKPLLDRLEDTRKPAEVTNAIAKAMRILHFNGSFGDFIKLVVAKDLGVQPKLNVVPSVKRILLDPFLDKGYKYYLLGAFNHRDNPEMFAEYCSPFSDKRGKYLDEMSDKQRHVFSMMDKDILAYDKKARDQGKSMIEDALNDAVRKSVNEEGSDTA